MTKNKKKIKVTKEELDNMSVMYKGKEYVGFSTGDKDVTLMEMAHLKRYGTKVFYTGASPTDTLSKFKKEPTQEIIGLNITEDILSRQENKLIGVRSFNSLRQDGYDEGEITLKSGVKINIKSTTQDITGNTVPIITLPDGTNILGGHAYSLKGYNKETKEAIIVDPHESSTDIRIPYDCIELFRVSI